MRLVSTCSGYSTGPGTALKGTVSGAFGRSGASAPTPGKASVQVQLLKGKCWDFWEERCISTCFGDSTGPGTALKGRVSGAFGRSGSSAVSTCSGYSTGPGTVLSEGQNSCIII
jgi:hypothetical protein